MPQFMVQAGTAAGSQAVPAAALVQTPLHQLQKAAQALLVRDIGVVIMAEDQYEVPAAEVPVVPGMITRPPIPE